MNDSPDTTLDRTDQAILRLLQANGRLSNADLAQQVNVSAATCHRRTQRLFEEGYIDAVHARLNPARVGMGTVAQVAVVLDRSTPESFALFEDAVRAMPMVLDCYLVAGDFDYLLKIRVRDMQDFNTLHASQLIALPGVRQARTFFVMKEVKDGGLLPL
ncbi:AsnC family transcriptional regulator [Ameyamaea chiangmaiensis NBRC 103196]|uniref:Lrp/AsnC family transcriptional regulator n=1 Tax=Ameyamaea chiangmaiensis TaxID=442969 RepID=A0A850PDX6_9PROT|nr:Lrp/AsnC family transcriptional regulator [Ameyamaea chiangmaiensis]MBS4074743.1 Lrp/AsnC family transcriptional regulator [Ameyamaea chiangmaiensis]NVN40142.1 Lrp/AsnC family transcriptional regulator [Ameyamaea chiangmaiensis]GBQ62583.1 AsnC family transcriptional regulator [Ameyamaea chiangmaiensis NBRC 103196]